jgi:hypothetical protein
MLVNVFAPRNTANAPERRQFMKRFFLYSLSATVALAVGSVARAEVPSTVTLMDSNNANLIAQQQERDAAPTEGIISPTPQGPNNRVVPGQGALESDGMQTFPGETFHSQQCRRFLSSGMLQEPPLTGGIISPEDTSPYNRAFPRGTFSYRNGEFVYDANGAAYQYLECMNYMQANGYNEEDFAPTQGIISPGPQSPGNRVVPGEGRIDSQ